MSYLPFHVIEFATRKCCHAAKVLLLCCVYKRFPIPTSTEVSERVVSCVGFRERFVAPTSLEPLSFLRNKQNPLGLLEYGVLFFRGIIEFGSKDRKEQQTVWVND